MKIFATVSLLVMSSSCLADYVWSEAIPNEVHITPNGLVLKGEFNQSGISCATGPKSIYLPKSDPNFEFKLSLALTANAAGKKIKVLLPTVNQTCYQISALGYVPIVHEYYWQLKN